MLTNQLSGRALRMGLILTFLIGSVSAFAEYVGQAGYGAAGMGMSGATGAYGSYPYMAGQYPQSSMMGGMGGMSGGSSSAKYETRSDVKEISEKGPEYSKQISDAGSKATEGMSSATKDVVSSIGEKKLEEPTVSEAVTTAANNVATAMNSKGTDEAVAKYEKETVDLAKVLTNTIATGTKSMVAALQAKVQTPPPVQTMGGLLTALQKDANIGAPTRNAAGSPLGKLVSGNAQGTTTQLAAVPTRAPASHALTQEKSAAGSVTQFERGAVHNPPSGF